MNIYQIYHKKELESKLLNKPYIIPYYTKDDYCGINHLQGVLNEFVCQYWVYKHMNYMSDDIVGFCHYRRFFNINDNDIPEMENNIRNANDVYGLCWYNVKEILEYNDRKNFIFDSLRDYITYKYPELLDRFQKMDWDYKSIRFECFISRYDDFCKYVEFILGYFKFMHIDFESCSEQDIKNKIDSNRFMIEFYDREEHAWYLHQDNHYRKIAYIIELLCGIYWSLVGKNINILDTKKLFKW